MPDTTFNTVSGRTIARELLIAYLNTGTSVTPVWSPLGRRVEESSTEIDRAADKDTKKAAADDEDEAEDSGELDELFNEAVEVVLDSKQASVSMLQRRLKLGYSRAARIVDQMEEQGVVGPFEGSKPRAVLLTREEWAARQGGGVVPAVPPLPEEDEDDGGVPEEID